MKIASKLSYVAILTGSFVLGTVVANPPVDPPRFPGVYYYYSDASHEYLVGMESVECDRSSYFFYGSAGLYRVLDQAYYCPPPVEW